MSKPTISLCILVKNGRDLFENCLASIADYVDEIVVVVDGESPDGCDDVARSFGAKVFYRKMEDDFAAQRNFSFEQATGDWLFWMDSDDIILPECAEKLHMLAESAETSGMEVFLFDYHYAFDERGEPNTILKRERLMKASLPWKWRYPIHEVCICEKEDGSQPLACYEPGVWIIHRKQNVREQYKDPGRNLRFIEKYMPEYEAKHDGRMLFYAGNECMAAGKYEEAFRYYDQLLAIESEWKEQRALAAIRTAAMFITQERYDEAKQRCYMAIDIDERWADPYCMLGDIAMVRNDWARAIHFFDQASNMSAPCDTVLLPYDPHRFTTYPLFRKHIALLEMQRYDESLETLTKLITEYEPDDQRLQMRFMDIKAIAARNRRNGLSGVAIVRGNLLPSHPSVIRQMALETGLRAAGVNVKVVTDPGMMQLGGRLAVVFDCSARATEEALTKIKDNHTDIVVDFCDPEENLDNEGLLLMLRNANVVTTNSPFLMERLRSINPNVTYIPDPAIFTTPYSNDGVTLDTIHVLMASTDEQMVSLRILPILQRVAEKVGKKLEFRILGATSMATRLFDDQAFAELAEWADMGIAYFPRDDQWRGAEFLASMMGAGLPVIVTGNAATNGIVDHRDSGIICHYPQDWEVAFHELVTDDALRIKMGRRAALRARRFDATTFTDRWTDALSVRLPQRLDVIVPCHGQIPYLRHCVDSLAMNSSALTRFILVVNPTGADDIENIRDMVMGLPQATVVEQPNIKNFASNCNVGVRAATGTMVSLLNSDTIVTPGWDAEMISTINRAGACIVAALSNGEFGWLHHEQMTLPSGLQLGPHHSLDEIEDQIDQIWEFGRQNNTHRAGEAREVDWVTFAAVMMPRTIFLEAGELDERFNNDSEDFDFCRRVRRLGGRCLYDHGAFVFHFCGTSRDAVDGGQTSSERQIMITRNHKIQEIKVRRENRIIRFFLGKSWEPWLPEDVDNLGIGGSETCVVNIARELSQIGWTVEVYSTERRDSLFRDGVAYFPHYAFDPTSPCDVLVVSRKPEVFDHDLNAKIKILYNHDATYGDTKNPQYPSLERVEKIDYLFVLSQWHMNTFRELYPHIPEEKFFLTQNGIDLRRFERSLRGFIHKDPKRFIYSSSGDRGLEVLLSMWPRLLDIDPEFRLHVYYGLETWKRIAAARGDEAAMRRIENVVMGCRQHGVIAHGRVGQAQLAEEFAASNLWVYPSAFTETSCITAMEAMVTGCRGITSPIAALNETALTAIFIDGDCTTEEYQTEFIQAICGELNNPDAAVRNGGIRDTIAKYDWRRVAASWDGLFMSELAKKETGVIRFKPSGESIHFVLPYGGSGGVQYPIELANVIESMGEISTKVSLVKFSDTEDDILSLLPHHPNIRVYTFDEFRSDPDAALDFDHVVAGNWQAVRILKEMGANRRVDLKRYTLIQGDERHWVPLEIISAMMSDTLWEKIYVSDYLRTALQVPGEVVHNGIDVAAFTPGPDAPPRDEKLIGCILHSSPIKNTQIVIDAVDNLKDEVRLLGVVAAGELEGNERIERVCEEVIWGPVDRATVANAMFRCGAWVIPSTEEGFGLVGLEAMAAGCVVITAAPGGMKTYTKPDENAIRVFNPQSRSDWESMMRAYLVNDRAEIAEMRRRGRATAEQYTLDKAARSFVEVLLGRKGL